MSAYLRHLLLIALYAPMRTNVVTVDKALLLSLSLGVGQPRSEGTHYELLRNIHLLLW